MQISPTIIRAGAALKKIEELHVYVDGSSQFNNRVSPATCAFLSLNYCNSNLLDWRLVADHTQGTSNRAELAAAIMGLTPLVKARQSVTIFSDSKYVIRGATNWLNDWQEKKWKNKRGKTVANVDLWIRLFELLEQKKIKWQHVRAHRNNVGNNVVDKACTLCWQSGQRFELSGEYKSEHCISDLLERKANGQRRVGRKTREEFYSQQSIA